MMIALGNGSSTDLSQYFAQFGIDRSSTDLSQYFAQFVASSDAGSSSPCASDASLWKVMLGSDGKCYTVCSQDPSMAIEIGSEYCSRSTAPAVPVPENEVPSWVLPVGAGALLLFLLTR